MSAMAGLPTTVLDRAMMHGPATCACVPYFYWTTTFLTFDQQARVRGTHEAWPLCPTCHGTGVDPRIAEEREACARLVYGDGYEVGRRLAAEIRGRA